ncbi:MAG: LysR substrate-binding domain-containing protein [Gluconacetobacter sp.]
MRCGVVLYVFGMSRLRMGLRHIEAYRAVSLTGSMTEASRRLYTSQPQVSRLIAQLEKVVGFPLFHRNGTRLSPTTEGARFFRDVEKVFVGLTSLEASAARIRSFSSGRLSVAAMPRLAGGLLARSVARFKSTYPDVLVSIHAGDEASVHSWIRSGQCDVGLAMLYADVPEVRIHPLVTIRCVAIMPRGHPLTAFDRLTPHHFDGQDFISFPAGSPLRQRIEEIFTAASVRPYIVSEAGLGASLCALVSAGLGIGLINSLAATEENRKETLEIRPFDPEISFDIVMMLPALQEQSRLVSSFAACVRETIAQDPTI